MVKKYTFTEAILKPPTREEIDERFEKFADIVYDNVSAKIKPWKFFEPQTTWTRKGLFSKVLDYLADIVGDSSEIRDESESRVDHLLNHMGYSQFYTWNDRDGRLYDTYYQLVDEMERQCHFNIEDLGIEHVLIMDPAPYRNLTGGKSADGHERENNMRKIWLKIGHAGFDRHDIDNIYDSADGWSGEFGMGVMISISELTYDNDEIKGDAIFYFHDRSGIEESKYAIGNRIMLNMDRSTAISLVDKGENSLGYLTNSSDWSYV